MEINGVGVKARVATAKRHGLDAHGMTRASGEWGQGSLHPLPPEPSAARVGSPEGRSPFGPSAAKLRILGLPRSYCCCSGSCLLGALKN